MTSSLKKIVEWYLGVESSEPGESTTWTWRSGGLLASTPGWLIAFLIVGVVIAVVAIYRRDARQLSWKRRWLLVGFRLATVATLLLLLFQVSLSVNRAALPYVIVMVDDSGSMQFQDDFSDTADAEFVRSMVGSEPATRLQLTTGLLTGADGLLAGVAKSYRLRLYRFAEQAELIRIDDSRDLAAIDSAILSLKGDGTETRPLAALQQIIDESPGTTTAAIVVLTDGISTRGEDQRLQSVGLDSRQTVPLYIVGTGSTRASADLELTDVSVDDVAIVDETVLFAGNLKSSGFEDQEVLLELRDAATDERLAGKPIRITESLIPVELSYVPKVAGEFDYVLRVVPSIDEHIEDNNAEVRHVSVRDGRIKVLLVDSLPRYEFRYLKHLLERSEGASGSIELSTILFDADPEWTALDESAARLDGQFPLTPDALADFDVLILGDVDPLLINSSQQTNIRDFVRESGGGLVLISGPRFNPHGYRGTAIEPLIPIALDQATASDFQYRESDGLQVEPTLAGRRGTALFRFAESEVGISRAVASLSEVYSHLGITEAPAGSTVIAADKQTESPLVVRRQYGAGRVVLHATDDLWMWRFRSGDEYYGRYWISLVRSLSRSNVLGRERAVELMTNRETYERGEDVGFQLRFTDSRLEPEDRRVSLNVDRRGSATEVLELRPSPEMPGVYTGSLTAPADGGYHAWVSKPSFDELPPATDFRVVGGSREMLVRELDTASMKAAATASRGRYYTFATARNLVGELPRGRAVAIESGEPIPLWSRPELLLLIASLLAAEWFLRKNARLV